MNNIENGNYEAVSFPSEVPGERTIKIYAFYQIKSKRSNSGSEF